MKIKWGVIGCGGIAYRRTIPGMMLSENSELVAVMDTNYDAALKTKEEFGAKYAFDKYEDVIALDEIDAVYIATPVFCHKEQAIACAKAGKHILLEKPMGLTIEESAEIANVCKESGVPYYPGCVTPTEIMAALDLGITTVKFFPANVYGGLKALKALSAPFPQVKFIPTGGVDRSNIDEFLAFDKIAAIGGSFFVKESLDKMEAQK